MSKGDIFCVVALWISLYKMGSLGANGNGGLWGLGPFHHSFHRRRHNKRNNGSKSSSSGPGGPTGESATASSYQFPLKQAATAASLALTGDTIAQLQQRWVRNRHHLSHSEDFKVRMFASFLVWIFQLQLLHIFFRVLIIWAEIHCSYWMKWISFHS